MRRLAMLLTVAALGACDRPANESGAAAAPAGVPTKGVDRSKAGTPAPTVAFQDPDGGAFDLTKSRGTPVLVNLWATWCAPCVKELPTLEALDRRHATDGDLQVMIVSQDMAPKASVDAFLKEKGIALRSFLDPEMALSGALDVQVMPTTILYDAAGKEVWRYTGDFDWSGEEAAKLIAEGMRKPS